MWLQLQQMSSNQPLEGGSCFCSNSCCLIAFAWSLSRRCTSLLARGYSLAGGSAPCESVFEDLDSLFGTGNFCSVSVFGCGHSDPTKMPAAFSRIRRSRHGNQANGFIAMCANPQLRARQNAATSATNVNCFNGDFTGHTAFEFALRDREQGQKQKTGSGRTLNLRSVHAEVGNRKTQQLLTKPKQWA